MAVGAILVIAMGASAAGAATAKTTGAQVEDRRKYWSGEKEWRHEMKVSDTVRDGHFVSGPWQGNMGSTGSIVNKNGDHTSTGWVWVTRHFETVSQIKACRSNGGINPMTCSGWVKTGY
ncbi:hypothetical protein [Oerskovia turbata]